MIKFSTMTSSFYLLFHEYTLVSLLTIPIYIVEIDRGEFVKRSKRPIDHPKSKMTAFATFSSFCDLLETVSYRSLGKPRVPRREMRYMLSHFCRTLIPTRPRRIQLADPFENSTFYATTCRSSYWRTPYVRDATAWNENRTKIVRAALWVGVA